MNPNSGQIRQGDVLLVPCPSVARPPGLSPRSEVILAVGEATGHAHRLRTKERAIYEWEVSGQRYVVVEDDEPGTISHEDHDPVPVPVVAPHVTYQVIRQQEWDISGQWRKITD